MDLLLRLLILSAEASFPAEPIADPLAQLIALAQYASSLELPTNSLRNHSVPMNTVGGTDHIFVNANLARVLLASARLTTTSPQTSIFLEQGLAWCDTFTELQAHVLSSQGNAAGYWGAGYGEPKSCVPPLRGDCAHGGEIYFGDTGTAVTTLAVCYSMSSANRTRQARYMVAMERFATFVLEGSSTTPVNKKGRSAGFVDARSGAVGCGYYACTDRTREACSDVPGATGLHCPSTAPYTIATGTTGGAFFASLYALTKNATYKAVAIAAMKYEHSVALRSGEMPYILDGANCTTMNALSANCTTTGGPWPFDTLSYVTEGIAAVSLHMANGSDPQAAQLRAKLVAHWKPTVEFLLSAQNPPGSGAAAGSWGVIGSGDQFRSPRCLTLLSWWLAAVETPTYRDLPVRAAVKAYIQFIGTSAARGSSGYGLDDNTMVIGMVGIALADHIAFGSSFVDTTSSSTSAEAAAASLPAPTRLRVEYLASPLSIDSPAPRFSWALPRGVPRGSVQSAYTLVVSTAPAVGSPTVVWDAGVVRSNRTLNIPYLGDALKSDTDYSWSVVWLDAHEARSAAAHGTFTVAILGTSLSSPDWHGAQWISSESNGSLSTYRAEFTLPDGAPPVRARLYIVGLGYAKTWINGNITDTHELGQYVTFEERVLYDCVDVRALLRPGPNVLGVMLGRGWLEPRGIENEAGIAPRQFLVLLSVTAPTTGALYFHSSATATATSASASALTFTATAGPVKTYDMFRGEEFDGRIALALQGWSSPGYKPRATTSWVPAIAPAVGPATWESQINAHHADNIIQTKEVFTRINLQQQPSAGTYVYDFGQNMAGQVTLRVASHCAAGTVISLQHAEVLERPNGLVRNSFCLRPKYWLCGLQQFANYTCSGAKEGGETYRVMFTSMGFRYVQMRGYPGVPSNESLTAHFIHSDVPQTGEFTSSSPLLNAIQRATIYSAASNQMDIPTDCPQRERQGWLGDAQLAFETVQHNFDGGAFYSKWIRDLTDVQGFDSRTRDADGAMPDTCPFYSTSTTELEADPGWGIAAWIVPTQFSSFYDDDRMEHSFYPHQRAYMEHWIKLAEKNNVTRGELPPGLQHSGDWGCMQPGPTDCAPAEYSHYFYITALALQTQCAMRLGIASDAARYGGLLKAARTLYVSKYFDRTTGCFGKCTDISQIFGLAMLAEDDTGVSLLSKAEEAKAWAEALTWFGEGGKYEGRFGGGIVSLKLLYPLLDAHGLSDLGLKFQLHTDKPPSFGYWMEQGGTTLFEYWGNAEYSTPNLLNSYNHIMYGGAGSWYYSTLAGLRRRSGSRSWRDLIIAPPGPGTLSNLTWANASIDTPMGLVSSSWSATQRVYRLHAVVPPNAQARIVMPTVGILNVQTRVTEKESGAVWRDGGFVLSAASEGIRSATAGADRKSVVLTVGSGSYSFTSSAN